MTSTSDVVQPVIRNPTRYGTKQRATSTTAPELTWSRPGTVQVGLMLRTRATACVTRCLRGRKSITTNTTMNGMLAAKPPRIDVELTYSVMSDATTPITRPPTQASEMLVNAPIAAAPKP
jgi:hypothetical protein